MTVYAPNATPLSWDIVYYYTPYTDLCYHDCSRNATTPGCTDGARLATRVTGPPFTITDGSEIPGVIQTVNIPWADFVPTQTSVMTNVAPDTTDFVTYTGGTWPSLPTTFSIAAPRTFEGVTYSYIA